MAQTIVISLRLHTATQTPLPLCSASDRLHCPSAPVPLNSTAGKLQVPQAASLSLHLRAMKSCVAPLTALRLLEAADRATKRRDVRPLTCMRRPCYAHAVDPPLRSTSAPCSPTFRAGTHSCTFDAHVQTHACARTHALTYACTHGYTHGYTDVCTQAQECHLPSSPTVTDVATARSAMRLQCVLHRVRRIRRDAYVVHCIGYDVRLKMRCVKHDVFWDVHTLKEHIQGYCVGQGRRSWGNRGPTA